MLWIQFQSSPKDDDDRLLTKIEKKEETSNVDFVKSDYVDSMGMECIASKGKKYMWRRSEGDLKEN